MYIIRTKPVLMPEDTFLNNAEEAGFNLVAVARMKVEDETIYYFHMINPHQTTEF